MSTITTQNWDGVTAPSIVIAGWTVDAAYATETSVFRSAPNGIGTSGGFTGFKFLTYNTQDGNSGNVQAISDFYLANSDRDNAFALIVRGSATPLTAATTQYFVEVLNEDFTSSNWSIRLIKQVAGVQTTLASIASIITSAVHSAWYQLQLTASSTTLNVAMLRESDGYFLQTDGTFGVTPVNCLTATDSAISGQGYSGMYAWGKTSHGSPVYTDDYSLATFGVTTGTLTRPQVVRVPYDAIPQFQF